VLSLAAFTVFLGGPAFAWRRALIRLGRQLFGSFLKAETLALIVPPFVAQRERYCVTLLVIDTVLASLLLGLGVGAEIFVGTYVLMFLSRYLYPHPSDPYYLRQIISDVRMRLQIANAFKDAATAARLTSQLQMFEGQLFPADEGSPLNAA
jgi:hypothetical protein